MIGPKNTELVLSIKKKKVAFYGHVRRHSWKQRENISETEPTKNKNGCQNKHLTK